MKLLNFVSFIYEGKEKLPNPKFDVQNPKLTLYQYRTYSVTLTYTY